jgi:hypothetical protein
MRIPIRSMDMSCLSCFKPSEGLNQGPPHGRPEQVPPSSEQFASDRTITSTINYSTPHLCTVGRWYSTQEYNYSVLMLSSNGIFTVSQHVQFGLSRNASWFLIVIAEQIWRIFLCVHFRTFCTQFSQISWPPCTMHDIYLCFLMFTY